MNWIHSFELLCYALSAVLVGDMWRKRNISELKLFLSGALAGYTLELLAVRVTDIYHYNPVFWLNIGRVPFQFPLFGGLMWGGLTVCALRIARRLGFGKLMTGLVAGFLVVSMDLLLDIVAIRLDGGFWVWEGREITPVVSHHEWIGAIWVNFLGYLFETPMIVLLSLFDTEYYSGSDSRPWWKQLLASVLVALGGIIFVGAMSLLALKLNSLTDEWFAFVAFVALWLFLFVRIVCRRVVYKSVGGIEVLATVFFTAMYAFCFAGLVATDLVKDCWWIIFLVEILIGGTIILGIGDRENRGTE